MISRESLSRKRKDRHTPEQRSFNMSRIRSTNTALEQTFFQLLDNVGITYAKYPKLYGKPDCFIEPNVVIFVDGDFWHGWHYSQWRSRMPKNYWINKIQENINRDRKKFRKLRRDGYVVLRVWEHTLKKNPDKVVQKIRQKCRKIIPKLPDNLVA